MSRVGLQNSKNNNQPAYDESEMDVDGSQAEAEMHRMQRQLRALENERRTYSDEARSILVRQTGAVEKLRKDNQYLQEHLRMMRLQLSDDKKSGAGSKRAEQLKEEAAQCQQRIKEAMQEASEMDKQIADLEKTAAQQRMQLGGVNSASTQDAHLKQVASLETRLNKTLIRFNKALEHNGKLREQIDVLRRERSAFQNSYKKFHKEMSERKKHMASIVQSSTSAYEARDDIQARMIVLKDRADKEEQSHRQEIKELERQLEQDRRLKEFLTIKTADRSESSTKMRHTTKNQGALKGSQELFVEKLDMYTKGFERIRQVTQCADIDAVVKMFTEREDHNFSLFNYTNEAHSRIEALNTQIAQTQRQLHEIEADGADEELQSILAQIARDDRSLLSQQTAATSLTAQNATYQEAILQVVLTIQDLAKLLNHTDTMSHCTATETAQRINYIVENSKDILADLWHVEQKTNSLLMKNMLIALPKKFTAAAVTQASEEKDPLSHDKAAGEQRAADTSPALLAQMLQDMLRADAQGNNGETTAQLANILGQGPAAATQTFTVPAPSESADFEMDQKPLTHSELTGRLLQLKSSQQ